MELPHLAKQPQIPDSCYIDPSARIDGDVVMGEDCSVWYQVAIRGDVNAIRIGRRTNIQDGCIFHTTYRQHDLTIGNDVSFGHGVIAHGCKIGDRVLLGMGSIVMDGAVIGNDVLIGAGSLVTQGVEIPDGHLVLGRPGKVVRPLREDERKMVAQRAEQYAAYVLAYRLQGKFSGWADHPQQRIHPKDAT